MLESYYQHMLGKQVSLAELVDLANRLTAKYRQDGYLLTQVVVPEQSIEGGKVRLQVIEGYLEHVQIKGTVDGPRVRVEELLAPLTENVRWMPIPWSAACCWSATCRGQRAERAQPGSGAGLVEPRRGLATAAIRRLRQPRQPRLALL